MKASEAKKIIDALPPDTEVKLEIVKYSGQSGSDHPNSSQVDGPSCGQFDR